MEEKARHNRGKRLDSCIWRSSGWSNKTQESAEQLLLDASKFGRVMRWLALPCYGVASPIEIIVDREIKENKGGKVRRHDTA